MKEVKSFKQSELVLRVSNVYNTTKLDISDWMPYLNRLCIDRTYQIEAITQAIIYLASGNYKSLSDLAVENFKENSNLQEKYTTEDNFLKALQLKNKLFANIDLATGTGKSYVIYAVAQIALGIGLVDKVLVLCPSLTIETGLKDKFEKLSSDAGLKGLLPDNVVYKNPSIVTANETVKKGDICVENVHAVYETTGSSISDSFSGIGDRVLVLNDESHHIFNKSVTDESAIKKWRTFLLDDKYGFKYILGFTGTAYIDDEYFPDVIYRYSLRDAIESRIVKNIDYIKEDESKGENEKFQVIYQNHRDNIDKYPLLKPLSIIVTKDINSAKKLHESFVSFLTKHENSNKKVSEKKVLIVSSSKEHKANIPKLKNVDERNDPVEWIISISMLTEGWDVKNVFQIVPWEDRAFDSKLLIAQVLGRGLRVPTEHQTPQPKVTVFNHKSWSSKIKRLVEEVLEIEKRIFSTILTDGERAQYHFTVKNITYSSEQEVIDKKVESKYVDFTRIMKEGISLESQSMEVSKSALYESVLDGKTREKNYAIRRETMTIDDVLDKLFEEFEQRDWEGKALKLGEDEYTQNNLPPREKIEDLIRLSMTNRGNKGDLIIEKNVHKILSAFTPLLRKKSKSVISKSVSGEIFNISSKNMEKQSTSVGMLRQDRTIYLSNNWKNEILDQAQLVIINEISEDESLPRSAYHEIDYNLLKTPVTTVISSSAPERKFIDMLCKKENSILVDSWIKSRDRNFYSIEYTCKYGNANSKSRKYFHGKFNPDFFIKVIKEDCVYFLVTEIKMDGDDSEENKAKYKYGVQHFEELNNRLKADGANERYVFHILSPNDYPTYFQHLKDESLLKGQSFFRGELENLIETNEVE
ncbi:MAG: DEAD/DEAH box helicase family protein [Anaerovoracaceae bacterium]